MQQKILIVDVDSKIPNLALMRASSYHKEAGDSVEFRSLGLSYYPHNKHKMINVEGYDRVYISVVFRTNKNKFTIIGRSEVIIGGTGWDLKSRMPPHIESRKPDYSIYPNCDRSYGFLTRGCIRNCYFCVVPEKEGLIRRDESFDEIIRHNKVDFLDNNILAYKGHKELLQEIIDRGIRCRFFQGLDERLITEENAKLLSQIRYIGEYIFAFDDIKDEKLIMDKLKILKKYISKDWKLKFYIYCHPDMDMRKDVVYRVEWCKKNKVLPYLMRDISCWESGNNEFYTDLAAYCNQPSVFKKLSFDQFMVKRTKNIDRRYMSIMKYCGSKQTDNKEEE